MAIYASGCGLCSGCCRSCHGCCCYGRLCCEHGWTLSGSLFGLRTAWPSPWAASSTSSCPCPFQTAPALHLCICPLQVVTNTQREEQYVLHQCGAPLQDLSQQYPRAKLFEIPLTAVSTPDTTVLGFLVGASFEGSRPGSTSCHSSCSHLGELLHLLNAQWLSKRKSWHFCYHTNTGAWS